MNLLESILHKAKKSVFPIVAFGLFFLACQNQSSKEQGKPAKPLSENFKRYWFSGEAEITSYKLNQIRYGEHRKGDAVLIFVTEDFLPKAQVKADEQNPENIPVLKLNATKKFNTGIYPYSIMQSTFYPLSNNRHALKVSASVQEWCGQVYMQLNNREKFEVDSHSYFQGEADEEFLLEKNILENELWTKLRIDPKSLETGDFQVIPALAYLRLKHKEIKAYSAKISQSETKKEIITTVFYPGLERELKIHQENNFPFLINSWTETYPENGKKMTTKAMKKETLKIAYWKKNSGKDLYLREELGLE
jgi:hypothetical protein